MPERVIQTTGDTVPEYRQDLPETPEPSRLCEPHGISRVKEGPVGAESWQDESVDEQIEIDLAIAVGEDPGWHHTRRARRWRGRSDVTVRQSSWRDARPA